MNAAWGVEHPGIGLLYYPDEAEARTAAGTAGQVIAPGSTCGHAEVDVIYNARRWPVRLICRCGENWRVVPLDALVSLTDGEVERA